MLPFCFSIQMSDPLTALMHAVQVTNLLKMLIVKRVREREEMGTRCESTDEELTHDDHHHHPSSEDDEYETESLSDIEYCFSTRLLDNTEVAKDGFRKQLERILCRDNGSPSCNADSGVSFSDSRVGSSCISTSDDEHSTLSSTGSRLWMQKQNLDIHHK